MLPAESIDITCHNPIDDTLKPTNYFRLIEQHALSHLPFLLFVRRSFFLHFLEQTTNKIMAKTNAATQAKGQKNLFSFFSKKPSASKPAAAAAGSAANKSSSSSNAPRDPSSTNGNGASKNNDTTSSTKQPSSSRPSNSSSSSAQPTPSQLKLLQKITVGTKLAVYWPDDNEYYPCVVTRHRVRADRGDQGTLSLT